MTRMDRVITLNYQHCLKENYYFYGDRIISLFGLN